MNRIVLKEMKDTLKLKFNKRKVNLQQLRQKNKKHGMHTMMVMVNWN